MLTSTRLQITQAAKPVQAPVDLGDYPEVDDLYVDNSTLSQFVPPAAGAGAPAASAAAASAAAANKSGTLGLGKKGAAIKNFIHAQVESSKKDDSDTRSLSDSRSLSDTRSVGKMSVGTAATVGYAELDHEYSAVPTEEYTPRSSRTVLPQAEDASPAPTPAAAVATPASPATSTSPPPSNSFSITTPALSASTGDLPDEVRKQLEAIKRTQKPVIAGE